MRPPASIAACWVLSAAWMMAACSIAPHATAPPALAAGASSDARTTLYLARRKWHIDVGFAAADLAAPLDEMTGQFQKPKFIFFGFGDRHYLMAKNKNTPNMLAALWPGPGMALVTAIEGPPAEAFGASQVIEITLSARQSRAVQAFVWNSLAGTQTPASQDGGSLTAYANGPYEGSLYFSAVPRYSALHTCNTWAAEALEAGGVHVGARSVIFAGQLWTRARKVEAGGIGALEAAR